MATTDQVHTLIDLWERAYEQSTSDEIFVRQLDGEALSYKKINAMGHCLAAYLYQRGQRKGAPIVVIDDGRPVFMAVDLAIHILGGVNIVLAADAGWRKIQYVIEAYGAATVFVPSYALFTRFKAWLNELAPQAEIICHADRHEDLMETDRITLLDVAAEIGKNYWREHLEEIQELKRTARAGEQATVYVPTDLEKEREGVMLTHEQVLRQLRDTVQALKPLKPTDLFAVVNSYGDLFERQAAFYYPLATQKKLTLGRAPNKLLEDLRTHKPTVLITHPAALHLAFEQIRRDFKQKGGMKHRYFDWAFTVAQRVQQRQRLKQPLPLKLQTQLTLARRLVLGPVKRQYFASLQCVVTERNAAFEEYESRFQALGLTLMAGVGLGELAAARA